ncbi:hypothetical protein NUITMVR1_58060 (plasmid) [Raoultella ornithinolytica]|nr:hypothetical protein NUITMVR1_58060 [Raoultella ornithinolytica]
MAIHDTGMFTVKEINRLKILQDVIDRWSGSRNARYHAAPLQPSAETLSSVRATGNGHHD